MNQGQIRQNSSCSTSAIMAGNNCTPSEYFVNFGQIVSSNNPTDQQSALSNLDQIPFATGSGRNLQIQTLIPPGVSPTCQSGDSTFIPGKGCPNNAANLGSVTNTIGSSRIITMALHVTF
jgi:hypothetical protein